MRCMSVACDVSWVLGAGTCERKTRGSTSCRLDGGRPHRTCLGGTGVRLRCASGAAGVRAGGRNVVRLLVLFRDALHGFGVTLVMAICRTVGAPAVGVWPRCRGWADFVRGRLGFIILAVPGGRSRRGSRPGGGSGSRPA
uniref:Uncharacterized protein n=1 Tax=Rhipicephalus appendiculatus TaxID=34631 RepID=A0A131YBM0_RHIAP